MKRVPRNLKEGVQVGGEYDMILVKIKNTTSKTYRGAEENDYDGRRQATSRLAQPRCIKYKRFVVSRCCIKYKQLSASASGRAKVSEVTTVTC